MKAVIKFTITHAPLTQLTPSSFTLTQFITTCLAYSMPCAYYDHEWGFYPEGLCNKSKFWQYEGNRDFC